MVLWPDHLLLRTITIRGNTMKTFVSLKNPDFNPATDDDELEDLALFHSDLPMMSVNQKIEFDVKGSGQSSESIGSGDKDDYLSVVEACDQTKTSGWVVEKGLIYLTSQNSAIHCYFSLI